jgi:hypothetical protein
MNETVNIMYYAVFAVGIFWTFMSAIQLFVGIKRGMKIRSEEGATKVVGIVGGLLLTTISSVLMIIV